jgi:hypothetical protein
MLFNICDTACLHIKKVMTCSEELNPEYSNMGSDGIILSVIEESLGLKLRRRKFWQKYICCWCYPKKYGTMETPILHEDTHDHKS